MIDVPRSLAHGMRNLIGEIDERPAIALRLPSAVREETAAILPLPAAARA